MFIFKYVYLNAVSIHVEPCKLTLGPLLHCSERDRDGRTERERIRQFREREEREHLIRKRNWLEVCARLIFNRVYLTSIKQSQIFVFVLMF